MRLADLVPRDRGVLNPKLWDEDNRMRHDVRMKLLANAAEFYDSLHISLDIKDVVVTGSNAQYVYTDESDVDVHIVADLSSLKAPDLARKFLDAARSLWGMRHRVKIKGHPVELYVEDIGDPPPAAAYSLVRDEWVKEPKHEIPEEPSEETKRLALELEAEAMSALKDSTDAHDFLDKVYAARSKGLRTDGEASPDNLAFKALRNSGIIDDLWRKVSASQDDELSIPEVLRPRGRPKKLEEIVQIRLGKRVSTLDSYSFKHDSKRVLPFDVSGYHVYVGRSGYGTRYYIVDGGEQIGSIGGHTSTLRTQHGADLEVFTVRSSYLMSQYQGKGLMLELYAKLITLSGILIMSDEEQSSGGVKLWNRLYSEDDVSIYGIDFMSTSETVHVERIFDVDQGVRRIKSGKYKIDPYKRFSRALVAVKTDSKADVKLRTSLRLGT